MGTFKVRHSGSWTTISNGTAFKVRHGDAWVNPTKVKVRHDGAWVDVWAKSDPVTLTFTCNASQGWRNNQWRTDNKVRFGAFKGTESPFTFFGDNLTVLEFSGDSTTGGYTSTSLAEALAVRSNVTSATLTLYRTTGGTNPISSSTSETLLVGQHNKVNGTAMSSYNAGSYVQTTNMQTVAASNLQSWAQNASKVLTLPSSGLTDFITHVSAKQMWVSELSTGWVASGGSGSTSQIYSVCDGSAQTNKPVLTVTLDY
tara:strand:- start:1170 stop:1940 length:771 start_codon:yes stop_codon:yes gene_type:complete